MAQNKIVIVLGASQFQIGFAGSQNCTSIPSYYGKPKMVNPMMKQLYYGSEAITKRPVLKLNRLIEESQIADPQTLKLVIKQMISDVLNIQSQNFKDYNIYLIITSLDQQNTQLLQQAVQELNFGSCTILYSEQIIADKYKNESTFLLLEAGEEITKCTLVINSQVIKDQTQLGDVAGKHITEYMQMLLLEEAKIITDDLDQQESLKQEEIHYFLAQTIKEFIVNSGADKYELSDGRIISFGQIKNRYTEVLQKPQVLGKHLGLSELLTKGCAIIKQLTGDSNIKVYLAGGAIKPFTTFKLLDNISNVKIMNENDDLQLVCWNAACDALK